MKIFLSAFLLLFFIHSFSQEININSKVVYRVNYQIDSNDSKTRDSAYMELLLGDNRAIFQSSEIGYYDSVQYEIKYNGYVIPNRGNFFNRTRTRFKYSILKETTNQELLVKDNYTSRQNRDNNCFVYKDTPALVWNLKNDTLTIGGYLCQKAETNFGGRIWDAWFSQELGIEEGPHVFSGLPGLIFQIESRDNTWGFYFIALKKVDRKVDINDFYKLKQITKKNFYKEKRHYQVNATVIDLAAKEIIILNYEDQLKAVNMDRVKAAKDNNWIELNY